MTRTIISPSDLSQRTGEILDRVREGELAVVASGGRSWASPQPMPMTWASSRRWAGSSWGEWGGVPKTGDHFERAGWSFEVIDMDDRRVDRGARGRNDRPARLPRGRVGIVDQQQPAVIGIADPDISQIIGGDAVSARNGICLTKQGEFAIVRNADDCHRRTAGTRQVQMCERRVIADDINT